MPRRAELGMATRFRVVRPYLIFYDRSIDPAVVRVIRVLHSRRKITRRLFAGEPMRRLPRSEPRGRRGPPALRP